MIVPARRSALSVTHFWARRRMRPRPSNPSACQPTWASRARATIAATSSGATVGTVRMTSPVAGFSTAMPCCSTVVAMRPTLPAGYARLCERQAGGGMPRNPVDRAAREGGGAPDVQPPHGGPVGRERRHGAEDELVERVRSAADVALEPVRIALVEVRGSHHVPREDRVAEPRGELLDARLHALHVAVGLARVVDAM